MATKNQPGVHDCYAAAEPDEPLFVLLGRDRHAPALVALWCVLREMDGEDAAKVEEARRCAIQMMAWGAERGRKYVGFGQTTLVGIMELIRTANLALKGPPGNEATAAEFLRRVMSRTDVEQPPEKGDA